MANQKLVAIDDAKIQTLSVEIKTLSIGRKQMTLAVFRQLPTAQLFDPNDHQLRFNGLLWGRVNYHWTGCSLDGLCEWHPHVHVVWQQNAVLAQTAVYAPVCPVDRTQPFRNWTVDGYICSPPQSVVKRFLQTAPITHPMYDTRYAEAEALDQLFIAV